MKNEEKMTNYFDEATTEIAIISLIIAASFLVIAFCFYSIFRLLIKRCRSTNRPPILSTISTTDVPSCTNHAFDYIDETTSARKIEERRKARQQELMQASPRADQTLRRIDPEIGKALAVEQLMRDSLVFDTLPRQPPKSTTIQVISAKRDYL